MFEKREVTRINAGRFEDWDAMERVLKAYARKLKINIFVSVPHNEEVSPESSDDTLHIMIYAVPFTVNCTSTTTIKTAYGVALNSNQEDCMVATNTLETVYDPDGTPVAEFTKNNIFVLFDLCHGPDSDTLINHVMDDYCLFIDESDAGKKRFKSVMEERIIKASRRNFHNLYTGEIASQEQSIDKRLKSLNDTIREYQTAIVRSFKERQGLLDKKKVIHELLGRFDFDNIDKRFEALEKIAVGGRVTVTPDSITVPVGQIDIEYDGKVYDIGDFDIVIRPDGYDGGVQCFNKTRVIESCYHPHIDDEGECCLGNLSESIPQLIGEMEYEVVIFMMLQFLRTCNSEGWYEDISRWPEKRSQVNEEG